MKVLVTGASGNVGRHVVKELSGLGQKVVAGGTDVEYLKNLFGDKSEAVYFDFTNEATFASALDGVDRFFLC